MIALALLLAGCKADKDSGPPPTTSPAEAGLEQYGLVGWEGTEPVYDDAVVPYQLATPLFSDYAAKRRAIRLPDGQSATYRGDDHVLDLPVGTTILKSFLLPADLRSPDQDLTLIETRVLQLTDDGWEAEPWLWEDGEARLAPSGGAIAVEVTGTDGQPKTVNYLVPQKNQCIDCHELVLGEERVITPIGPKARHLNVGSQLEDWAAAGLLTGLPAPAEVPAATDWSALGDPTQLDPTALDNAARDYLDINCAHCHNRSATEGVSSQLFLDRGTAEPFDLGVCKRPGSAGAGNGGLTFDIVPGDHSQSILWFRIDTEQVGAMMPDIGRSVRHDQGVDLVAAWIDGLTGTCN